MVLARGRRLPRFFFLSMKRIASQLHEIDVVVSRRDHFVPEKLVPRTTLGKASRLLLRKHFLRADIVCVHMFLAVKSSHWYLP